MTTAAVNLTNLENGQSAQIIEFAGGSNFQKRAEALGLRPGVTITRISAQILHGPIMVRVNQTRAAMGYGMAQKILVLPLNEHPSKP